MLENLIDVRRTRIGALEVMALREFEVVETVSKAWSRSAGGSIVTVNVDIARAVRRRPELADLVAQSEIVVADGMPLVWASKLADGAISERVTGSSLVFSLSAAARRCGEAIHLVGGDPGIPAAAAARLSERYPGLRVSGAESPPFGFERSREVMAKIVARIVDAAPGLVFVGLGFPKQERLIRLLRTAHPRAWYLGCGAGIAMAAGQFPRAPAAMQRIGVEWLHRLALEPQRLARRYLWDDAPYAAGLLAAAAGRGVVRSVSGRGLGKSVS